MTRCPDYIYNALRYWHPTYNIGGKVMTPRFEKITFWRNTGDWAAYYWMNVRGPRGITAEKFVWTFRNGRYVELCQYRPEGTDRRQFIG